MLTTINRYMRLRIDGESYKVIRGDFLASMPCTVCGRYTHDASWHATQSDASDES